MSAEAQRIEAVWRQWLEAQILRGPVGALELRSGRDVLLRIEQPTPDDLPSVAEKACEVADERERTTLLALYALDPEGRAKGYRDVRVKPGAQESHDDLVRSLLESQNQTLQQLRAMAATTTSGVAAMTTAMGNVVTALSSALQTTTQRAADAEARAARVESQASDLEAIATDLRRKLDEAEEPTRDERVMGWLEQIVSAQLAGKDTRKLNGKTTVTVKPAEPAAPKDSPKGD